MAQFNFPSDILQALDALNTLNSGAAEPPATAPFMLWMDTSATPAVLKQRNGDDTGWIDLFAANAVASIPVGTVNAIAGAAIPDGWLECNGAEVSRTQYADLFGQIGTVYGAGDGSSTFNLPDLRGEFIRGLDNGRGVDAGRELGTVQEENARSVTEIKTHSGTGSVNSQAVIPVDGSWSASLYTGSTTGAANHYVCLKKEALETRPRNVALTYIIKY